MELGLSLGDASKTVGFLKESKSTVHKPTKTGLDFCMALGLNSPPPPAAAGNQEHDDDDDDDDDDEISQGGDDDDQGKQYPLQQLNLLPLLRPQISSHHLIHSLPPWSSDHNNGSSENGSSGNMGLAASVRGLDVNRVPAAEEVSSANSVGSPLIHGMYTRNNIITAGFNNGNHHLQQQQLVGVKRSSSDFEAAGNDVVDIAERASSRASDDDDINGANTRKKLRLSKQQSAFLEESFKEHHTLNPKQKLALAKQLNLRPRQVEVWFQNRRARTKLKQTEVDCEYLKRCCETLSEENRRLHKELQELRALKTTSNPFYMQLPATTLTMCPSCERVAATATAPHPHPSSATPPLPTKTDTVESIPKSIPFPLTRPRFYPRYPNNQPAAS